MNVLQTLRKTRRLILDAKNHPAGKRSESEVVLLVQEANQKKLEENNDVHH